MALYEVSLPNTSHPQEMKSENFKSIYNKKIGKVPEITTLNDLIRELHVVFESDHVNIEYVHALMSSYKSNPADWKKFAKFDRYKYTRNLVDKGNDKFNLMILCWNEGQGSLIHDHANAHCFMKMLQGQLSEIRFEWPKDEETIPTQAQPNKMVEISRTTLHQNEVCYINDELGLHRVENPSHSDVAISLHLYCPPFNQCAVFDLRTGQKSISKVTFWSLYGHRKNKSSQENEEKKMLTSE
ncbi:cysteine dioxygenase type 1 [Macrosteles quadrilineatus]|uniref:cysteine dioxygenase type 1 n=1 Tax=Macrosteles quadrilineatus TaxID=74068 RepID=UPI0023E0F4A1|nr:cysteine dioxygenase type 1 [Macrosteles quadrilineatus]XP_054281091.1 cysteine dioxygenase type 1 [Macrosteles quadrilineatus]